MSNSGTNTPPIASTSRIPVPLTEQFTRPRSNSTSSPLSSTPSSASHSSGSTPPQIPLTRIFPPRQPVYSTQLHTMSHSHAAPIPNPPPVPQAPNMPAPPVPNPTAAPQPQPQAQAPAPAQPQPPVPQAFAFPRMPPTNNRTPDMMPPYGDKAAPPKFRGSHEDVKRFLRHYTQLCNAYNLIDQHEKCERVLDYCSRKVTQLIEALPAFQTKVWRDLESEILEYFDADLRETRFTIKDIVKVTKKWRHRQIKSLTRWKEYERKFITIAGWLLNKQKISVDEQSQYFWHGINKSLRRTIESRLLAKHQNLNPKTIFPMNLVREIAANLFERNRFDYNLADSDTDVPDWELHSDSESSDSDSSESDSASAKRKARKKKTHHKKSKLALTDSDSDTEPEKKSRTHKHKHHTVETSKSKKSIRQSNQDEVEQLIRQMGDLSIQDAQYALAYYKAIKLDPDVVHCVRPPAIRNQYETRTATITAPVTIPPLAPPATSAPAGQYQVPRGPMTCYGCGEVGHGLRTCPKIAELVASGAVIRDTYGRVTYRDGTLIRREYGETIAQAVEKRTVGQSHFIMMGENIESDYYQSEEEEYSGGVLAAEKQPKSTTTTRKEIFDGVYMPPIGSTFRKGKGKENAPVKETPKAGPSTRSQGPAASVSPQKTQPVRVEARGPKPIPVDVRKPRFEPNDNDVSMDDAEEAVKETEQKKSRALADSTNRKLPANKGRTGGRQSEISAGIGETQVVDNILNTPVTLRVREVLASSRELSDQLLDMIKRKNVKPTIAPAVATAQVSLSIKDRAMLIKLPMECDGKPVTAIIDTGSQLNVVSKEIYQNIIKRPMDPNRTLTMNDANGGSGKLRGHVSKVPLSCGSVMTHANLYIGDKVPFDLLLGRPWQ